MTTFHRQDVIQNCNILPTSTFYEIMTDFFRTFSAGVSCRQGELRTPGTVPLGTCVSSTCWDRSLSWTCRYFLDYSLPTSFGTFSNLHNASSNSFDLHASLIYVPILINVKAFIFPWNQFICSYYLFNVKNYFLVFWNRYLNLNNINNKSCKQFVWYHETW